MVVTRAIIVLSFKMPQPQSEACLYVIETEQNFNYTLRISSVQFLIHTLSVQFAVSAFCILNRLPISLTSP
jgi:hypothetical protein